MCFHCTLHNYCCSAGDIEARGSVGSPLFSQSTSKLLNLTMSRYLQLAKYLHCQIAKQFLSSAHQADQGLRFIVLVLLVNINKDFFVGTCMYVW